MSIDTKYIKVKETIEEIEARKRNFDTLSALKTILDEATQDGMIAITIDRNKQGLSIPASLLTSYILQRKGEEEAEVNRLVAKVDIK